MKQQVHHVVKIDTETLPTVEWVPEDDLDEYETVHRISRRNLCEASQNTGLLFELHLPDRKWFKVRTRSKPGMIDVDCWRNPIAEWLCDDIFGHAFIILETVKWEAFCFYFEGRIESLDKRLREAPLNGRYAMWIDLDTSEDENGTWRAWVACENPKDTITAKLAGWG